MVHMLGKFTHKKEKRSTGITYQVFMINFRLGILVIGILGIVVVLLTLVKVVQLKLMLIKYKNGANF